MGRVCVYVEAVCTYVLCMHDFGQGFRRLEQLCETMNINNSRETLPYPSVPHFAVIGFVRCMVTNRRPFVREMQQPWTQRIPQQKKTNAN